MSKASFDRLAVPSALSRRSLIASALATAAAAAVPSVARADGVAVLNDASRLNPTPTARHFVVQPDGEAIVIERLRAELRDAAAARRPVALGIARHSMGGQSLARGGTALTFEAAACSPDSAAGVVRCRAGTRWRDVIATLDPLGLSPAVMQSNNDFGVASTFSVNAHGWPVPHGPFGTTVRSLRLMLADGSIVTCSPQENEELFRLAMGGYGLFGIILDLDAEAVPNRSLLPSFEVMAAPSFGSRFVQLCSDPAVSMAYGRLNVAAHGFLGEALMIGYRPEAKPSGLPPAGAGGTLSAVSRRVYRSQTGSEAAKRLRWFTESMVLPRTVEGGATRNTLLNEPVSNLAGYDAGRTDILHEYFVPPDQFAQFISACQDVIPRFHQELLNVTLRFVEADRTSVLAYAPGRRIAAVMSFSQKMSVAADADMQALTQALIDRVLALGGSFYLPYRLHARRDQVQRAYPALASFASLKRRYDPGLLFRNGLWDTWLAEPTMGSG